MNALFKSALLSQCLILGFSHAYAGGGEVEEEGQSSSTARPTVRMALTMPWKPCDYNGRNTFNITLKGARYGQHKFSIDENELWRRTERQTYYFDEQKQRYIPLNSDQEGNFVKYGADHRIREFLLFPHFDLSWFEGDITVSMTHRHQLPMTAQGSKIIVTPIKARSVGTMKFTPKTTSVDFMLDYVFRNVKIKVNSESKS